MLNFKLKANAIDVNSATPIVDYLKTLGITETDEFINYAKPTSEICGAKLTNAAKMTYKLKECFETDKKFFLIVDCDTDGFTSSAIFYNYFKYRYPDSHIEWMLHEEKQHGIEMDKIPDDAEVIIVPDAGSNQIDELTTLNSQGRTVLVMDHHQVEIPDINLSDVIIVNNQTSADFNNKSLSGAGVVFKIIQLYDKLFFADNWSNKFYDLAALGIIADCMDSRTLDNNYIIKRGLGNINNKMFLALIDKQAYQIPSGTPNKIDVAYYIAPLINGTIRMGTMEEKEKLFRGFIETPLQDWYEHTWRGVTNTEDAYHHAARIAYNVKNEQNKQKMKCLEFLQKRIEEQGLNNNKIIAVITYDTDEVVVPKTITGLVAMELLKLYGKPSLVLRPTTDKDGTVTYTGSGRSNNFEELPSFLNFVRDQEESVFAQGHACAFGCSVKADEFDSFIQACNDKLSHIDFAADTIYVDACFDTNTRINHILLTEFASNANVYGNQIPEPLIAIEGEISGSDIRTMGTKGNSVRIDIKNIPCIKFKDDELVKHIQNLKRAKVTVIGKPVLNEYMGIVKTQLSIQHIDLEPLNSGGLF